MSSAANAPSIRKLAIRGTVWTVLGYGASQVLRFGSNLVLTRLLAPDLFGLMSIVNIFIIGLHLFSDIGLQTNIVQSKRGDDPVFLNTAWTVQVLRGAALWLCCLLLAFPVSQVYGQPQLLWLIPFVGLNSVISGFNSTAIFSLSRHLGVKQLAIYELLGQTVSVITMLTWAWFNPSILALAAGSITSALFYLMYSHWLNSRLGLGLSNRFTWERKSVKELISFGKWIFVSTIMTFLSTQADRLILGTLFTLNLLGIYGIAFALADIPHSILSAISGKVMYPTYARFVHLPRAEFRSKMLRNRAPILMVLSFGVALMVGLGDLLVQALYPPEYAADAAWMLPLIALGTWPLMLSQTVSPVLFALGKPRFIAFASFLSFLFYGIGIPVGFHIFGPVGAITAVATSNLPIWIVVLYALNREKLNVFSQDMAMSALFGGLLSCIIVLRSLFGLGMPFSHFF